MNRIYAAAALFLAACAVRMPAPELKLPEHQALWFKAERIDEGGNVEQTSLLSVQGLADGQSRWLLADAFGAPQARMLADKNGWRRDGFAPADKAARELFAALAGRLDKGVLQPQTVQTPSHNWQISPIEQP